MYTETELREAMQHSAVRADQLIAAEQQPSAERQPSQPIDLRIPIDQAPAVRRRTWLPAAAAAAVLAVAGGSIVLAAKPSHRTPAPPQKDVSAAAPMSSPSRPVVASPRTALALANLITIPGASDYEIGARMETLTPPRLDGIQAMALPASGFDPAKRLTDQHPVSVAGAHGYAGKALIYLIDPNDPQQASKAGRPRNTVAWPVGDGTWVVLQSMMADGADFADVPLATLIHDAGQLSVQAAPAPLRSGYRAHWLPAGLTLTSASGSVGNPAVALTLTAGSRSIMIELDATGQPGVVPVGGPGSGASRHVAGYWVSVIGTGYDQATARRVLDGLDFSRLHGPHSGWWTLTEAVNG